MCVCFYGVVLETPQDIDAWNAIDPAGDDPGTDAMRAQLVDTCLISATKILAEHTHISTNPDMEIQELKPPLDCPAIALNVLHLG